MRWARELQLVRRPSRIAIGYHHRDGNGRGHRAMAERLQSRLQQAGYPTDIVDRSQDELNEAVEQRATYFAKLHVGRNAAFVRMLEGTESIPIPGRFEFDWTPDMGPLDLMPFSMDMIQLADTNSTRAALAEVGVETRGRQIVTVSGGGAGTGMEWRLTLVAKALDGLDVLVVGSDRRFLYPPGSTRCHRDCRGRIRPRGHCRLRRQRTLQLYPFRSRRERRIPRI